MRILVTGATGFVGRRLVAALLRRGDRVRALGRNPDACTALAADGAEVMRADLRDRDAANAACDGMDVVCHVGALSAPWGRSADFHAINVGGTEHVLAGCRRHGVGRMVYVSSPSVVFDGTDHRDLTEDAPYPQHLMSVYSLTKKLGEDRVRAAAATGLATVIVRPKAVFGPGDVSLLPRLLAAGRQGRLPQVGHGRNLVDLTYVDNVVHALILALTAEAAVGETYTITNGEHVALWDLIKTVLRRQGIDANLRRLPYRVVYALAGMMELRATLFGGEPLLTRYTAAILAKTQTYDITAARRDLGYEPVVSVAEGVERTLADLGSGPAHPTEQTKRR
ncbi:MAG TPA: NAD-dependent epimerase/dehydratase family protein [Gemmataceae bacterium]|nr:NAD-dependent epimerase/dehydratase family protein [Gemmataceae bacterium]